MITETDIRQLPKQEKLRVMAMIWEDLSRDDSELDSPPWHAAELASTERRFADGEEEPINWNTAKETLRQERQ
jgi:hypothetical protein